MDLRRTYAGFALATRARKSCLNVHLRSLRSIYAWGSLLMNELLRRIRARGSPCPGLGGIGPGTCPYKAARDSNPDMNETGGCREALHAQARLRRQPNRRAASVPVDLPVAELSLLRS